MHWTSSSCGTMKPSSLSDPYGLTLHQASRTKAMHAPGVDHTHSCSNPSRSYSKIAEAHCLHSQHILQGLRRFIINTGSGKICGSSALPPWRFSSARMQTAEDSTESATVASDITGSVNRQGLSAATRRITDALPAKMPECPKDV